MSVFKKSIYFRKIHKIDQVVLRLMKSNICSVTILVAFCDCGIKNLNTIQ